MQAITKQRLVGLLGEIKGATFATLITETDARLRKTGNPYGNVRKVSRVNVCLGFKYEAAVNRQLVREGAAADFQAAERAWGEHVEGAPLVENKGKLYLNAKVERSLGHEYFAEDGTPLSHADVAPFLPAKGANRQGTEKEIIVRTYSLDSIRSLAYGGEQYVLLQDVPATIRASVLQGA